jgi:hypothetical protein
LLAEAVGLNLTELIPNHLLVIVLILQLIEVSSDLQESSGRIYVNSIQSISLPSANIYKVIIKPFTRIDIA